MIVSGLVAITPATQQGDEENQAALIVSYGPGNYTTACVGFSGQSISGLELLQSAGIPTELDYQGGGTAVCKVGNAGCPSDDCFCRCGGGENCIYWSYWHQAQGSWTYSLVGAHAIEVANGDVEGWVWGPGSITEATPPPLLSFDQVCSAELLTHSLPGTETNFSSGLSAEEIKDEKVVESVPSDGRQLLPWLVALGLGAFLILVLLAGLRERR